MSPPVVLFKGSDPSLVGDAVAEAVRGLVGDEDRSLMVDEFDADRYEHDGVADAKEGGGGRRRLDFADHRSPRGRRVVQHADAKARFKSGTP